MQTGKQMVVKLSDQVVIRDVKSEAVRRMIEIRVRNKCALSYLHMIAIRTIG